MNILKANYRTIVMLGSDNDFVEKLKIEKREIGDILKIRDEDGASLLEIALAYRKFSIAKMLLEYGSEVNVVTGEGYNEFHIIAASLYFDDAIEIAKILLKRDVDLSLQDKKYGNTAMLTLCMEVFKKRTSEMNAFLCECLSRNQGIEEKNRSGYNVRRLIKERGSDEMKKIIGIN